MEGVQVHRIPTVWGERDPAAGALAQQRRQFAADLHDLVMQDLALALANARGLATHSACADSACADPTSARRASDVIAAGERAMAGARHLLVQLSAGERRPVVEAVEDSVRAAAQTTPISFDARHVPHGSQPDEPTLHALVHIGREAVANATKHSDPTAIEVVLERADEWRLCVRDDGRGWGAIADAGEDAIVGATATAWTPATATVGASANTDTGTDTDGSPGGFGLESMRRCAHALGGSFHVSSAPGGGTTVEAILP